MRLTYSIITWHSLFIILICILEFNVAQNLEFKINKLNLIWNKAQHSLGPGKLKDLKNDLTKHEYDELALKKMKSHNQDKDGLFEASVRKKLLSIMSKYSLERYYDDIHPSIDKEHDMKKENLKRESVKKSDHNVKLKSTFRDKKLDKLWKKAEESGFTQEQLMVLHEEFQHQQDKLDEHYDTMNMIEQELDAQAKGGEKWENSIENQTEKETMRKTVKDKVKKESSSKKKARLDENIHQNLKEKYSDIKKNIDKLHKKIISGKINNSEGPFEEETVNNLWFAALEAKFTESELESFKEELEHYEVRIKKLKHFQVQLERDSIGIKDSSSNSEESDESRHLRKRVQDLANKVDKTHASLESMIHSRRDEL